MEAGAKEKNTKKQEWRKVWAKNEAENAYGNNLYIEP